MVFNATFNNISVISWRSALLVEETGGPVENHRPAVSRDKIDVINTTVYPIRIFRGYIIVSVICIFKRVISY